MKTAIDPTLALLGSGSLDVLWTKLIENDNSVALLLFILSLAVCTRVS